MTNTMTLSAIDSGIRGIGTRRTNDKTTVQTLGLAILRHAMDHGDCTRAVKLARVLSTSERSQLRRWFGLYSPISIRVGKTAADDKASLRKQSDKNHNTWSVEGATANPWHTMEKETVVADLMDVDAVSGKIASFLTSLTKSVDGKVVEDARPAAKALILAVNTALLDYREAQANAPFTGEATAIRLAANGEIAF